jgi:putative ABC transport system substrate-binding protein
MPSPEIGGHMRRREFITLLGGTAAAWPLGARAQQANVARVGIIDPGTPGGYEDKYYWSAFFKEMHALGYVEGKNIVFEARWANGDLARLAGLANELVNLQVKVIVARSTPVGLAARSVTSEIPIVVALMSDPWGLVLYLASPVLAAMSLAYRHSLPSWVQSDWNWCANLSRN